MKFCSDIVKVELIEKGRLEGGKGFAMSVYGTRGKNGQRHGSVWKKAEKTFIFSMWGGELNKPHILTAKKNIVEI